MPNDLPKAYDPAAIEERWAARWAESGFWTPPAAADGNAAASPVFTMLLPPPNVTGRLHMGHMLNQTEMDILARWHRMRGDRTLWVPGTDHAGIATQMMVERQLASEGSSREALGRERFIERVWQWRDEYGGAILDQMRRLGASVDWSREYFTMDERLSRAVREAFVRLHEAGLVYRGQYIVNWDPVQATAVSDLEVTHEERMGKLYHLRYPLADGSGEIVIATTRPETMLGDVAVAVNPSDARYTALLGKQLKLPLTEREIPILADSWANPEFGTGAVKVTPAHDPNDFAIGERHGLPQLNIMDTAARIDLPGSPYHGLDRYAARERIVADLDAAGLLVAVKDHPMSIGLSQRTGAVIEPRLSTQWFLRTADFTDANGEVRAGLARKAREAVAPSDGGEPAIRFTPDQYRKVYLEWMDNIHDWCISRQLWWGHRIPAWFCAGCSEATVAREIPSACTHCGSAQLTQETDVLDTWFSSGLLPFTVFGWPEPTADLRDFYPTSLLVTGFDILFFWVARMVMFGCWFMGDDPGGPRRSLAESVPFREVYIHALVRDADRQKMSKTKGNVIDPIAIVGQYGTDAVRFTLASMASPGTDIAFNEGRTEGYRAFANKIWNAARFISMQLSRAFEEGITVDLATLHTGEQSETREGRYIRSQLGGFAGSPLSKRPIEVNGEEFTSGIRQSLAHYRFDSAAHLVYTYFWTDFCDFYLEAVKIRLELLVETDKQEATKALRTLIATFECSLRLLSPFMPFITEELWHNIYDGLPPHKSIALAEYPTDDAPFQLQPGVAGEIADLQEFVSTVLSIRKERGIEEKVRVPVLVRTSEELAKVLEEEVAFIERRGRVSSLTFVQHELQGTGTRSTPHFDVQVVYEKQIDVAAERERLGKDLARFEKEQGNAERQLGNESFLAKAPAPVVEGIRRRSGELTELLAKTRAALDAVGR